MSLTVEVVEIVEEAIGIKSFRLARVDGMPLGPYEAGAHVDVVGPTNVTAQYSLCSPPHQGETYLVAVKLENSERGASAALHNEVRVGSQLRIGQPRTLLKVADVADRHVLLAAGIGITPMLSIAYHLHAQEAKFDLHYFARSNEEAAFVDLLRSSGFADSIHLHFGVDRETQLAALEEAVTGASDRTHVYTCGPEGFMARVTSVAGAVVSESNVHIEHFHGVVADTSADTEFEVELDDEVYVIPVDKTIAQVLEENGIEIDTSCREGVCGTCIMDVLSGSPDHRDACLTAAEKRENTSIAVCVSRALSPRISVDFQ